MRQGWFSSWTFRTRQPTFSAGEVLEVYVGNYDNQSDFMEVRIGDTLLRVEGGDPDIVDKRIRMRVSEFNESDYRGNGELLAVLETEEF